MARAFSGPDCIIGACQRRLCRAAITREQIIAATLSGGISSPGAILSKPTEDPSPIRAVLIGSILIERTQPI